jgi:3-methyladenine DNA glycosylase/8-oxoguanine DNA glycosylase
MPGDAGAKQGLGFDPRLAIEHLRAADKQLSNAIDALGPFHLELTDAPSIFAALSQAIIYQQLHANAAATIHARFLALSPRARHGPTPARILRTSDSELRAAGLSRQKVMSLRDLAQRVRDHDIPTLGEIRRMEDELIIERLTRVRGIGRWSAQMLLIFRLGRPDVLPIDDFGLRRGLALILEKRDVLTPSEVEQRGARWAPYRTVASWYLWRAAEAPKT